MADEAQLREYLEKATVELQKARRRLRDSERRAREPIAIVGMACRYPGKIGSGDDLWDLVAAGRDAIGDFPTDRGWDLEQIYHPDPDHPGTTYFQKGGFLDDLAGFDAGFFGISPREAVTLDPQQRLMLETSWEAIEGAGVDPSALHGTRTAVFIGGSISDYALAMASTDTGGAFAGGSFSSVLSGRVSYAFGLQSASISIDTACSSSLVAIHLASQALRQDECSLALAGGVVIMATPNFLIDASRQRAIAPDGRCKAFSELADGTVFSEGAGVLLLERLSEAKRNGHPILALVRGSAVNQDGASNGLAAPNGPAQERAIREALASAGLTTADVDAVEAHGTGTPLGDPIEASALLATYGQGRVDPLRIGSVKSNIGHAAAAAGVAGVIKMTMAMREGVLPKTLYADTASNKIDWAAGAVELLTEPLPWKREGDRPRRAGVSSFGMSGTNVHLILEEPPAVEEELPDGDGPAAPPVSAPVVVSAKSPASLRDGAKAVARLIEREPDLDPVDLAFSMTTAKPRFPHRLVAQGGDRDALLGALHAAADGLEAPGLCSGVAAGDRRTAFVFSGFGSQWPGMTVELIDASPAYAGYLRECDEALAPHVGWSVEDALRGADGAPPLELSEAGPPALFATTVALAKLWRHCGVEPSAVVGHSQGELVAAHIAGGLSLEDAARMAVLRLRALLRLEGKGALASVALPAAEIEARLDRYGGRVGVAAINGPAGTTVSGDPEPLEALLEELAAEGVQVRKVKGGVAASHSIQVEEIRDELIDAFASISPRSGDVPFYSTVTGEPMDTADLDAEYWYRNTRNTVRLEPVVRKLLGDDCRALLEVSPHPVLGIGLRETVEVELDDPERAVVLGTMRRGEGGPARFALSLAEGSAAGMAVDWERFFRGTAASRVQLPTYAFERKRYWQTPAVTAGDARAAGLADPHHPLLGALVEAVGGQRLQLTGRLSTATQRWLVDYAALGTPVVAGGVFVELALEAAGRVGAAVERLALESPLALPDGESVQVRVSVGEPVENGEREVEIYARPESEAADEPWTRHAVGSLAPADDAESPPEAAIGEWPPSGAEPLDVEAIYDRLDVAGLDYGSAFRSLRAAWSVDGDMFVELVLDETAGDAGGFGLHPALIESLGQLALLRGGEQAESALPVCWRGVFLRAPGKGTLRARVRADGDRPRAVAVDESGAVVISVGEIDGEAIEPRQLRAAARRRSLYRLGWEEVGPARARPGKQRIAVLGHGAPDGIEAECYASPADLSVAIEAGAPAPNTVLAMPPDPPPGGSGLAGAARANAVWALELAQEWVATAALAESRLVLLTRGAVAAAEEESPDLAIAPIWGLVHSAHTEYRDRFGIVDFDDRGALGRLMTSLTAAFADEPQLAIRAGKVLVPRLARAGAERGGGASFDPGKTVLITGGTSGVGAQVARHLVSSHGVGHLLLVSRSGGEADGAAALATELGEAGAEVTIAACDVADRDRLAEVLDAIPGAHPLGAVIHSAAVLDNGVLESLDRRRLEQVMRPKVDAAWNLHELTRNCELSHFVLFSSIGGILGNAAQVNYAAANTFVDALAAHRRADGLPALSIAWGGWMQDSNLIDQIDAATRARIERLGIGAMLPEQGLEHFDTACAADEPLLAPILLDPGALRDQAALGALPSVLRGVVNVPEVPVETLSQRLAGQSEEERKAQVLELVRDSAAAVLGHSSAADVEPGLAFQEMGLDSLGTLELCNALSAAAGVPVTVAALMSHSTPNGLAQHLLSLLASSGESSASAAIGPEAVGGGGRTETAFVSLLDQAAQRGEVAEFVEMLSTASRFRPLCDDPGAVGAPRPIRLATGDESPGLVLIPSVGAMSGTHEYVRLAREFDGERTVIALPLPGFGSGEPLPASVEVAAGLLAQGMELAQVGDDFVLAGHSSGGWLAHALSAYFERAGNPPTSLFLFDTYLPQSPTLKRMLPGVVGGLREVMDAGLDDVRLTAMGGYSRLFADWEPTCLQSTVVSVRAGRPLEGVMSGEGESWRVSWPDAHLTVDVPGDHMSMMTDDVAMTARAIRSVLNGEVAEGAVTEEEGSQREEISL